MIVREKEREYIRLYYNIFFLNIKKKIVIVINTERKRRAKKLDTQIKKEIIYNVRNYYPLFF